MPEKKVVGQQKEIDTNLKWETNEQTNIGIDFAFMNNELSFRDAINSSMRMVEAGSSALVGSSISSNPSSFFATDLHTMLSVLGSSKEPSGRRQTKERCV